MKICSVLKIGFMEKSVRVSFITLGCKLNYAETSTIERQFVSLGCKVSDWRGGADIFVVNTCAVTETSERKCRSIIRKLHRISPSAWIVVTGCYARLGKERIYGIEGVRYVFTSDESKKGIAARVLGDYLAGPVSPHASEVSGDSGGFFLAYSSGEERTRAFLKVQDGCDYHCSYCTVCIARGGSRNAPVRDIVSEASAIAASGVREIVLTGVNTGDFGKTTGESFLDLLKALDRVEGIDRYRISSIEPNLLTEEIVDWITSGTKFMPHFHIPLQSGSDRILKAMGRRYDADGFLRKLDYVRKAFGDFYEKRGEDGSDRVFFGIDVIVGFPGETEADFMDTYNLLSRIKPAFLHVFPYSKRPGTPAASMPGQVPEEVKNSRVERLMALSDILHADFVKANSGRREEVLFESSDKGGRMYGYTRNYIRVERPFDPDAIGRIIETVI